MADAILEINKTQNKRDIKFNLWRKTSIFVAVDIAGRTTKYLYLTNKVLTISVQQQVFYFIYYVFVDGTLMCADVGKSGM